MPPEVRNEARTAVLNESQPHGIAHPKKAAMLSALAPIAQSKKVPFFATESEKSDCEGRTYCSLFRNEEDEWGKATWKVLRKYKKKNIGIVKNQNQFMRKSTLKNYLSFLIFSIKS